MTKYFRYHNTNCFFLESPIDHRLLAVDAGWPCTLYEYQKELKTINYRFSQIAWAVVTHFHMDHAGLISEFIESGIQCLVFENQTTTIDEMERVIRKNYKEYRSIDKGRLVEARTSESRMWLRNLGIGGEVIVTPGHSDDSISLVTDDHEAIIGDLAPMDQIMPDDEKSIKSWSAIKGLGAKYIYPSHAALFEI